MAWARTRAVLTWRDVVRAAPGNWLGAKAFTQHSNIFKREYLDKTEAFFAKYGAKTVRHSQSCSLLCW